MDRRVLWVGPQILRVVRCLLRVNRSMNRKVLRVTRQILRVASRVLRMEEECYEWHEKYYVLKKINVSDQTNTTSRRRACRMIISVLWVERQALRDKTNVMIWMNKKSTTWTISWYCDQYSFLAFPLSLSNVFADIGTCCKDFCYLYVIKKS